MAQSSCYGWFWLAHMIVSAHKSFPHIGNFTISLLFAAQPDFLSTQMTWCNYGCFLHLKKYIASVNSTFLTKAEVRMKLEHLFYIVIWLVKGTFLILYDNLIAATFDELNHPLSYVVSSYLSCPIYNICPK